MNVHGTRVHVYVSTPHAVQQLIRRFKAQLERPTEEGFGYRVDLDLRPEGRSGVLANSVDAALTYYETWGAEWERQMLIRLRPVAGPLPAHLPLSATGSTGDLFLWR